MNEEIIIKLLKYLGDSMAFDWDDLRYCCDLDNDEIERCKELVQEAGEYV